TATLQFTLPVTLAITTAAQLPVASIGIPYNQTLAADGGAAPYTWAVSSGSLPEGLSLSAAGVISGTPASGAVNASFSVTVTDSAHTSITAPFTLPVLTITTNSPLANGTVGGAYNQTLTGTGGTPPYKWSIVSGSGSL